MKLGVHLQAGGPRNFPGASSLGCAKNDPKCSNNPKHKLFILDGASGMIAIEYTSNYR